MYHGSVTISKGKSRFQTQFKNPQHPPKPHLGLKGYLQLPSQGFEDIKLNFESLDLEYYAIKSNKPCINYNQDAKSQSGASNILYIGSQDFKVIKSLFLQTQCRELK